MVDINKLIPLSETTFYTLLALKQPAHGYLIMQYVRQLSNESVDIAAGTMYGILENLLKHKLIEQIPSSDSRRRTYKITSKGESVLALDIERIKLMISAVECRGTKYDQA